MPLADTFQAIVDSLPDDWTDLELDLRIHDETRYIDAATYLVTCNAQPYSKHDWRTDTLSPFSPNAGSSVWLGNNIRDYTAHIIAASVGYQFK